jgi:hypothetical protein
VLALAAAGVACGGKSASERAGCRGRLVNRANAAVVQRAYAEGKLGSRTRVQRELGKNGPRFFRPGGSMVPYPRLGVLLQADFNEWMYGNLRVQQVTGDAQRRATDEATRRADDEC